MCAVIGVTLYSTAWVVPIGRYKAITAAAHKMLVAIWYLLTKQEADRHADPEAVARSFMNWASLHHFARSQNLHRLPS
jgi:hypothetical protein